MRSPESMRQDARTTFMLIVLSIVVLVGAALCSSAEPRRATPIGRSDVDKEVNPSGYYVVEDRIANLEARVAALQRLVAGQKPAKVEAPTRRITIDGVEYYLVPVNEPKRVSVKSSDRTYVCDKCGWKPRDDGPMNNRDTFEPLVAAGRINAHELDHSDGKAKRYTGENPTPEEVDEAYEAYLDGPPHLREPRK